MYGQIEVAGWEKTDAFKQATPDPAQPAARINVYWYDKDGFFLQSASAWETGGGEESWMLRKIRMSVPRHARSFALGIVFDNAAGLVKLDDIVVSATKDTWDTRH